MSERTQNPVAVPNGPAAAAMLSAGVGSFVLGVVALIADANKPFGKKLAFYLPTGPLSGISTIGIVVWITSWAVLAMRWRQKTVAMKTVAMVAILLLLLAVLFVFPPFEDLLQGK